MSIALPSRPRIRGVRRIRSAPPFKGPAAPRQSAPTADMTPRLKRAYYSLCGSQERRSELTWRFAALLKENASMTLPEAILYILLEEREQKFSYQSAFDGGRSELGGAVTDFVISMGGYALAVLVNGSYWHHLPVQVMRDIATVERVTGQMFEGEKITQTLMIWEGTLLSCDRERAVDLLLTGIEVGDTK